MNRLLSLLLFVLVMAAGSAQATDHLEGILPLARDDAAALAAIRNTPSKHVLLYFGDHAN